MMLSRVEKGLNREYTRNGKDLLPIAHKRGTRKRKSRELIFVGNYRRYSTAVFLKLSSASEFPRDCVKMQILILGYGLRFYSSQVRPMLLGAIF